ncbi:MAG: hypothetical protein QM634_10595, partial [Gordonia sp. (in: high G+C Gram-positive bacteria)]
VLQREPDGLEQPTGGQSAALRDRLPLTGVAVPRLPELPADPAGLARWAFRVGDDGPLMGAHVDGRAVTLPLLGPTDVAGDDALVALVVCRCIAAGAAIGIHTARPAAWEPLLNVVGDHSVLALGAVTAGAPTVLAPIDLVDRSDGDVRSVRLTRAGAPSSATPLSRVRGRVDGRIDVRAGSTGLELTNVAGVDECRLVGGL